MSRILLVNPLISDYAAFDLWLYPFGLDFIGFILRKYTDFDVSFIDFLRAGKNIYPQYYKKRPYGKGKFHKRLFRKDSRNPGAQYQVFSIYGMPENILRNYLLSLKRPEVVLVTSLMSYWYEGVMETIRIIRDCYPDVPVIAGGMWPTQYPGHCSNLLSMTKDCFSLAGPELNQLFSLLADMNLLKDHVNINIYEEFKSYSQQDIPGYIDFYPLITSLGCPFNCSFCLSPVMHRHNYTQRNADNVIKEIMKGACMKEDMVFFDDALLYRKEEHIKPVLRELAGHGLSKNRFHLPNGLNTALMDEELALLFKRLNFKTIRLSVEGFDSATMHFSGKKIRFSRFLDVLRILDNAGIEKKDMGFYLLFGLPGQDFQVLRDFAREYTSKGYYVGLSELTPVPGTPVFDMLEKQHPEISKDPLNINNTTFIHNYMDISEQFYNLKREIKSLRLKNTQKGVS